MFDLKRWQQVHREIAERAIQPVRVVAVTKGQALESLEQALAAGVRAFGESYLQEALEKQRTLRSWAIEWHFIGRIQSNKTRLIAEHFDWVHALMDRSHGERLSRAREVTGRGPLSVCVQVNISGESSKGGVTCEALPELLAGLTDLPGIRVRGLMTLPELVGEDSGQKVRQRFSRLRELRDACIAGGYSMDTLSMGMSGDYREALAEGATLLRLGTLLFGSREVG